jgi:hypothetical protein
MNPENLSHQFKEHVDAIAKMQRIDARFGDNYGFTEGEHHKPEKGAYHSVMYTRNDGKWAGEIQHYDDGHVGHLYVNKEHRAGLSSLILHASRTALQHGGDAPRTGRDMTPKAEKLFKNQLPTTRNSARVEITKPIDTYGDK